MVPCLFSVPSFFLIEIYTFVFRFGESSVTLIFLCFQFSLMFSHMNIPEGIRPKTAGCRAIEARHRRTMRDMHERDVVRALVLPESIHRRFNGNGNAPNSDGCSRIPRPPPRCRTPPKRIGGGRPSPPPGTPSTRRGNHHHRNHQLKHSAEQSSDAHFFHHNGSNNNFIASGGDEAHLGGAVFSIESVGRRDAWHQSRGAWWYVLCLARALSDVRYTRRLWGLRVLQKLFIPIVWARAERRRRYRLKTFTGVLPSYDDVRGAADLFSEWSDTAIQRLLGCFRSSVVPPNAIAFHEGEPCDGYLYLLKRGSVQIFTRHRANASASEITPCRVVLPMSLKRGARLPAFARAGEKGCTLLRVARADIEAALRAVNDHRPRGRGQLKLSSLHSNSVGASRRHVEVPTVLSLQNCGRNVLFGRLPEWVVESLIHKMKRTSFAHRTTIVDVSTPHEHGPVYILVEGKLEVRASSQDALPGVPMSDEFKEPPPLWMSSALPRRRSQLTLQNSSIAPSGLFVPDSNMASLVASIASPRNASSSVATFSGLSPASPRSTASMSIHDAVAVLLQQHHQHSGGGFEESEQSAEEEVVTHTLHPWSCVGLEEAVMGEPLSYSVVAVTPCTVYTLSRDDVKEAIYSHPDVCDLTLDILRREQQTRLLKARGILHSVLRAHTKFGQMAVEVINGIVKAATPKVYFVHERIVQEGDVPGLLVVLTGRIRDPTVMHTVEGLMLRSGGRVVNPTVHFVENALTKRPWRHHAPCEAMTRVAAFAVSAKDLDHAIQRGRRRSKPLPKVAMMGANNNQHKRNSLSVSSGGNVSVVVPHRLPAHGGAAVQ